MLSPFAPLRPKMTLIICGSLGGSSNAKNTNAPPFHVRQYNVQRRLLCGRSFLCSPENVDTQYADDNVVLLCQGFPHEGPKCGI